ncbi:hypothetical protein BEP19_03150 [Ammoniphilus oxalaticus]|uniref:Uncharacterized protein n=1 Tax=Ammoniphilus oxalaticus TaxID=66863 RepID=A0A419SNS7_9BACL|nr:hypothetical protein [Ammoniphilus oxalaticus]RKD25938.1 hypothetical protein BEP19_03150 [Ammoniphilus oxalaticus]
MNKFTEAIAVTSPNHPASIFFSQDLKLSMRYTYNDLIRMEKWVTKRYPTPTEIPKDEHYNIMALGLYLGQVLVHSFAGAFWEYEDIENPFDARVIIPIEGEEAPLQLDPFTCVFMYIVENRKEYSMIEWYSAIRSIYEGKEPRSKGSKKMIH